MSARREFELVSIDRGKYVCFRGSGLRVGSSDLLKSTRFFFYLLEQVTTTNLVLADYSKVRTVASNSEIFNMVCMHHIRKELLDKFYVAFVVSDEDSEVGVYFEDLCEKKNIRIKMFNDLVSAERWVLGKCNNR